MAKKKTKSKNNSWIWILAAVLVVVAGILVVNYTGTHSAKTLPATVTPQEAAQRIAQGAMLLDVREQSEWDAGHVDGAVLIPLGQLSARMSELPKDQDIMIICHSGNRSGQARDLLRKAGYNRTTSIAGGIAAWMADGLPVITGN